MIIDWHAHIYTPEEAAGDLGTLDDDAIAWCEGVRGHADCDELAAVVHLSTPLLHRSRAVSDVHDQDWMRVDQLELRNGAVERDLAAAVVDARNGVMGLARYPGNADEHRENEPTSCHAATFTLEANRLLNPTIGARVRRKVKWYHAGNLLHKL